MEINLGECACISIPLLITVACISRCRDAFASGCAFSESRRIGGETALAWRLNLGECTCKCISLLITVVSTSRCPDAGCVLSGPRRFVEEQRGD